MPLPFFYVYGSSAGLAQKCQGRRFVGARDNDVKALASINWRRWIATLCVALVAFVMVERVACTDPCEAPGSVSYSIAQLAALTYDLGDQGDQPAAPAGEAHHCNSLHGPAMPSAPHSVAIEQAAIAVLAWAPQLNALQNEQGGQDRPPRASVIV